MRVIQFNAMPVTCLRCVHCFYMAVSRASQQPYCTDGLYIWKSPQQRCCQESTSGIDLRGYSFRKLEELDSGPGVSEFVVPTVHAECCLPNEIGMQ